WDELWYEYGDKNFSAISYSDYSYIFSISPVRMYSSLGDVSDLVEVEDLPETIKDNNQLIDSFGRVYFTRSDNEVLVRILYNGEYKLKYTFDEDTDFSMFNTLEAYYINVGGNNPQIFLNLSDNY